MMKKFAVILLCLAMIFAMAGCKKYSQGNNEIPKENKTSDQNAIPKESEEPAKNSGQKDDNKIMVKIIMEDDSVMELELYKDIAPVTVENFVNLAKDGFYDGLTFHRIISGFMIQGGDPKGTGMGGSKKSIKGEFSANGVTNDISHKRGTISMARSQDYNSASSQFFIVHEDTTSLDGQYAAFGKLVNGFETLDKLAATKVGSDGQTPITKPVIKTITVE